MGAVHGLKKTSKKEGVQPLKSGNLHQKHTPKGGGSDPLDPPPVSAPGYCGG